MAYTPPTNNGIPDWLAKYRAALEAGRKASSTIPAPKPATTSHVIEPPKKKPKYIPPGPEPGSYTPPGLPVGYADHKAPEELPMSEKLFPGIGQSRLDWNRDLARLGVRDTMSLYDQIDPDMRRTYGLGTDMQRRILGYQDANPLPSDRRFGPDAPPAEPYSDDVPRLFDYAQQADKFGTFEDYQKAVDARKHGYVPNDYADLAGEGDGSEGDEEEYYYPGYPGYDSGYGSGYGSQQQSVKPDWQLWTTFIQQTTWNV